MISVRVSNHQVWFRSMRCPTGAAGDLNKGKLFYIAVSGGEWAGQNFSNTGVLQTTGWPGEYSDLADNPATPRPSNVTADFEIEGCGLTVIDMDVSGIRDPYITLTIMETNLVGRTRLRAGQMATSRSARR